MAMEALPTEAPGPAPDGVRLRSFRAGDDATWLGLQSSVGIYDPVDPELFEREFGRDGDAHAARILIATDARDHPVATAAAWTGWTPT